MPVELAQPLRPRGAVTSINKHCRRCADILLLPLLLLAGCEVGPDYHRPDFPVPARYSEGRDPHRITGARTIGGATETLAVGEDIAGDWWALFRALPIDALVATALRDNPGVDAARAALRNAEELALAQYAGLLPSIAGAFSRQAGSIPESTEGFPDQTLPYRYFDAQLNFSYDFDVWGGTRRGIEQRRAAADYQRSFLEATDLTLTGNVVSTAVTIASLEAQIRLQRDLVGFAQRYLATLRVQFDVGAANGTDVALQQSQVAQQLALLPPLEISLEQQQHLLAAYLGRTPVAADLPEIDLQSLTLPATLPLSLPAVLLDHRPDIQEAADQLHEATAAIGVAAAARLPQFTITGSLGSAAESGTDLFTGGNGLSSFVAQALQPVFQGGQLLHNQRAAEALAREDAALWRQTVIGGYQNVADVLSAIRHDGELLAADLAAEQAASKALSLSEMQYRLGGVALLTVLQSEIAYQTAAISLVRAQASRFTDSVALLVALGGGWWNRHDVPPPPPDVLPSLLPWSAS